MKSYNFMVTKKNIKRKAGVEVISVKAKDYYTARNKIIKKYKIIKFIK